MMLGFMGVGPQELIILGSICCLFVLPGVAAVALIVVLSKGNRPQ